MPATGIRASDIDNGHKKRADVSISVTRWPTVLLATAEAIWNCQNTLSRPRVRPC